MSDLIFDGVSFGTPNLTYAIIDTFSNYIQLPSNYYKNYISVLTANHKEIECSYDVIGYVICFVRNKTCAEAMNMSTYSNVTIRFTDDKAFVVPPSSYL